jgi:hypothetical protein
MIDDGDLAGAQPLGDVFGPAIDASHGDNAGRFPSLTPR